MYPAMTLDGFIADPDGNCYEWISEADEALFDAAIEKAGCSLMGRKSYDQYKEFYPAKNGSTTFVYTHNPDLQDQDRVKFVRGTPQQVLEQIQALGFSEVVLAGGGELNGSFAEAGLIDEIILSIYPVTLGEGIALFGSHKPQLKLKLLSTTKGDAEIVKNRYRVLR